MIFKDEIKELEETILENKKEITRLKIMARKYGKEPPLKTVLMFDVKFGSKTYTYCALRVSPGWFLTGRNAGALSWESLVTDYLIKAKNVRQLN